VDHVAPTKIEGKSEGRGIREGGSPAKGPPVPSGTLRQGKEKQSARGTCSLNFATGA